MHKIVYGLLYLVSLLPMWLLYGLSDLLYLLIYYIVGYRKKVVMSNLAIALPDKTEEERKKIAKQFYRNFVDNFIEVIKLFSGGEKFAKRHFHIDTTVMDELYREGRKVQFHVGHNFNWEMVNIAISGKTAFTMLMVYMPIGNKMFDKMFYRFRTSTGNVLLPANDMKNAMMPYRNGQYILGLAADQVPGDLRKAYWLNFFGKPTPFVRGPERGARTGNLAVVFANFYKTRRGYYSMDYEVYTKNAGELPEGELTREYARYLEKVIYRHPDMWLWSHRRWKREWKEEYRGDWIDLEEPGTK